MKQYIKRKLRKYPRLYALASSLHNLGRPVDSPSHFFNALSLSPYDGLTYLKPIEIQVVDKKYESFSGGFSVVIPVKNEAHGMRVYLDDLKKQTAMPNEIIFFDHDSTDGTPEIIAAARAEFPCPVRLLYARDYCEKLNITHTTLAQNRNFAVRASKSEIILMTDAGCTLPPTFFADLAGPMLEHPDADMSGANYSILDNPANITEQDLDNVNWQTFLPPACSLAIRRAIYDRSGGLPEFLSYAGEDTLFDITCRRLSHKWVFNSQALIHWHAPKDNETIWNKFYKWGIGDGENGVGDYGLYPPVRLQKHGEPIMIQSFSLQWKAFCFGYLEGKMRRGIIDLEKRGISESILLVLEYPLFKAPSSLSMIKSIIDSGKRVVAISCTPEPIPIPHSPVFLDFDISLLELHYSRYFSLEQFWACYGDITCLSRVSLMEDKGNSGPASQIFFQALQSAWPKIR